MGCRTGTLHAQGGATEGEGTTVGTQFSEEFLLGYRAGHRDGFADAVVLMRDAVTAHQQGLAVARREEQLAHLLSGGSLVPAAESILEKAGRKPEVKTAHG